MNRETTIPILPCHSINETLDFYRAIGFEVTYQQAKPNTYAVVVRGGIELHFFSMRGYEPVNSYSTCYVRVPDIDGLYQTFTTGLRQKYGRIPSAGIPRVIPLKNKTGRREFILVDPGGNWIRIGQPLENHVPDEPPTFEKGTASPLAHTLHAATLLSDAGHDDRAANMLDTALAQAESAPVIHRLQALIYRAGLALNLGDPHLARNLLQQVRQTPLSDQEREALTPDLRRAEELEQSLS